MVWTLDPAGSWSVATTDTPADMAAALALPGSWPIGEQPRCFVRRDQAANLGPGGVAKFATLRDDFSAPLNPAVWTVAGVADTVGGRLRLTVSSDTQSSAWTALHDLTESHVFVELVDIGTPPEGAGQSAGMVLGVDDYSTSLSISVDDGAFNLSQDGGILQTATYDPAVHRWLRLRHAAGVLHFEHSPDGSTWVDDLAVPLTPVPMWLSLDTYYNGAGGENIVVFDNVNVAP